MTGLGLAAAQPFNSTKSDPLLSLGPVFAIRAQDSIEGEQWALNKGTGGQVLRARYGSVGRAEIRRGVGWIKPPTSGNVCSIANAQKPNLTTATTIDYIIRHQFDKKASGGGTRLISNGSSVTVGFDVYLDGFGVPIYQTNAGAGGGSQYPVADGETAWLKVEWVSGTYVNYYYANDSESEPTSWTLFTTSSLTLSQAPLSNSLDLTFGDRTGNDRSLLDGCMKRVIIRADGATVLDVDFTQQNDLTTSFTCTTGQTVTVTAVNAVDTNDPKLLKKTGEDYTYHPNAANFARKITTSLSWGTSTSELICKAYVPLSPGNGELFGFRFSGGGSAVLYLGAKELRVGFTDNTAAGNFNTVGLVPDSFFNRYTTYRLSYSTATKVWTGYVSIDDGASWTTIGTSSPAKDLYTAPNNDLCVGTGSLGVNGAISVLYAEFKTDGVTRETFYSSLCGQTGYGGWVITRTTSGDKLVVVNKSCWLLSTDDFFEILDNPLLDFTNSENFTAIAIVRMHATLSTNRIFLSKRLAPNYEGYSLSNYAGATNMTADLDEGPSAPDETHTSTPWTNANLVVATLRRTKSSELIEVGVNNTFASASTTGLTNTFENASPLSIGRIDAAAGLYADFELYAAAIYRKALTNAEIASIVRYWNAA